MNTAEHTFPLPETEVHKLDIVEQQIPFSGNGFFQSYLYPTLAVCAVAGCLIGFALRKRH